MSSSTHTKRLLKIAATRLNQTAQTKLTDNELEWFKTHTIATRAPDKPEGRGDTSPPLDILSITAPELNLNACSAQIYIEVECVHGGFRVFQLRCRKCPGCDLFWRSKVRALIMRGAADYANTYFWTLTVKEFTFDYMGPLRPWQTRMPDVDPFDFTQAKWRKMTRKLLKKGVTFEYFRIIQNQERLTPHFHMALNRINVDGKALTETDDVRILLRSASLQAGFGTQDDFQRARYGGPGVASYLSKYISEGGRLVRRDGRSIRRYCRSRGWCSSDVPTPARYASRGFSREVQAQGELTCGCDSGQLLPGQIEKWLKRNRSAGYWVAPTVVGDIAMEMKNA